MIAIIDYGAGNLQSVMNALNFIGCACAVASSERELDDADGVILPGVGAFGAAMDEMNKRGLTDAIRRSALAAADGGKPFIGVCAGMQLLFDESEESPGARGLSALGGKVLLFPGGAGLKVPHMGWNSIEQVKHNRLFSDIAGTPYMYFVHSYYVKADDAACVAARAEYGVKFDAAVETGNLFGCQFHPEKSWPAGMAVLKKFVSLCAGGDE